MIVCKRCGRENQDHYKFCLGCGAELAADLAVAQAPTQTPPPEEEKQPPPAQVRQPAEKPASQPEAKSADSVAPPSGKETASSPPGCPQCGAHNPPGFAFCGNCGSRLKQAPEQAAPVGDDAPAAQVAPTAGASSRPVGQLSLIRPDGTPDGTFALSEPETIVGRSCGDLFAQDGYLSPHHARFYREGEHVMMEDLDSQNGVFVRITGEEALLDGDLFRVGQELLRFDAIAKPKPAADGTFILGSPNPGYWGRLSLVVGQGIDGSAFPLMGDEMVLGRERGDILFSDDGYVSSTHAKLTLASDGGGVRLVDLGSSNGTFMRLREPRRITPGTFVLMGQQLFRFEVA